jgi:DNA helicase-2/ATP-dependent DNA helicase PcrA
MHLPSPAPELTGDAANAVVHRGTHVQIIASAGSGKTEVVAQRVAALIGEGISPGSIVAFTFTERAAAELKHRIELRVADRIGENALNRIAGIFVGTIHAYCFQLLQRHVPRYETYDVLDDNQLTAFLSREATRLGIRQLDDANRLFASIHRFLEGVDVIENELLDPASMPEPFRTILANYLATLERYRLLTFGQQIVRAVRELERPDVVQSVHAELRHLIVDEYQDVNPAQEHLIELLAGPAVELCVVGDDDQAIYQWRGSDVSNIVTFRDRYAGVTTFEISTNRRSRPQIIDVANRFVESIPNRLDKQMSPSRPSARDAPSVVLWSSDNETKEAGYLAHLVLRLNDAEVPFRDIAVLVRGRAAYPRIIEQFATFGIPVQPGSRTGLFDQPEALVLGQTIVWLTGLDWRSPYHPPTAVSEPSLLDSYQRVFELDGVKRAAVRNALRAWKAVVSNTTRQADLVGELYELLDVVGVRNLNLSAPLELNRMGTLARFSALLADYESVRRRSRSDPDIYGEQVGGEDRGTWYYKNLGIHIINYAQGAYDGFDGEADFVIDAVDLTTVHRAKGLEWPVVFVPSMTSNRFPSSKTGQQRPWLVPRDHFAADRYEGSDADERRLFYVAMTRARDWLSVSRHARVTKQVAPASQYYRELIELEADPDTIEFPDIELSTDTSSTVVISYSELAMFLDCGMAFRLRNLLGFQPRIAPELGYGKAVHHVLRTVADITRDTGAIPTTSEIDDILDANFFLPIANKPAHRQLKEAARKLITNYATDHPSDLHRVWETERPFELHLAGITVNGRADVILDHEGGVPTGLAILDYKTSTRGNIEEHALQLQVYADAGRREGLDVRGAYVHDLKAGKREEVDVSSETIGAAETSVVGAAERLRDRDYAPNPGDRCRRCEVRTVCRAAYR